MVEVLSGARSSQVASMDAVVMITIALCLEVFLFGLAAAVVIAHEAPIGRAEAEPASANVSAATAGPRATARARRAVRGMHS
jgi:hypothetical protein